MATTNPELLEEWDYERNGDLNPEEVSKGSHQIIIWKCFNNPTHPHSYPAPLNNKRYRMGCGICHGLRIKQGYNDLATMSPAIAEEWDYSLNGDLTPDHVARSANIKVYWRCKKKGHGSYPALISSRTNGKTGY